MARWGGGGRRLRPGGLAAPRPVNRFFIFTRSLIPPASLALWPVTEQGLDAKQLRIGDGVSQAGLLDASGNVFEWTRSLWVDYPLQLIQRRQLQLVLPVYISVFNQDGD